jgi:hypothetical protein
MIPWKFSLTTALDNSSIVFGDEVPFAPSSIDSLGTLTLMGKPENCQNEL